MATDTTTPTTVPPYPPTSVPPGPSSGPQTSTPPTTVPPNPNTPPTPADGSFNPTGTGTSATQGALPPAAAQSAYQFETYVASVPVVVGDDLAQFFPANQLPTNGSDFIKDVLAMSPAEQVALEWQLWQAGLYVDANGALMQGVQLGDPNDPRNFLALINVVIDAQNQTTATPGAKPVTLSDVIKRSTDQGTLQGLEAKQVQRVTGGGQTYQVETPDPRDVYMATQTAFQNLIGRNPTQAEYAAVLATVNQSFSQYATAKNTQTEQMQRAQYNAGLESRTALLQPTPSAGALPATQPKTATDYAVTVLQTMGLQATSSNIAFVLAWIAAAGGLGAGNNPLGVTVGVTEQNRPGPGTFPTWQAGLVATMRAIGNLPAVYAALLTGDASGQLASSAHGPGIKADLNSFSSGAYGNLNTDAQKGAAQAAVPQAPAAAAPPPTDFSRSQAPDYMGPLPAAGVGPNPPDLTRQAAPNVMGPLPSTTPPGTELTRQAAPNVMGPLPSTTPATTAGGTPRDATGQPTTAPGQTGPGTPANDITQGQNVTSPGDVYVNPTTIDLTTPPNVQNAAEYAAERVGGGIPYYANNFLTVMGIIHDLINSTASAEHVS